MVKGAVSMGQTFGMNCLEDEWSSVSRQVRWLVCVCVCQQCIGGLVTLGKLVGEKNRSKAVYLLLSDPGPFIPSQLSSLEHLYMSSVRFFGVPSRSFVFHVSRGVATSQR
jgi:hypothetical protein